MYTFYQNINYGTEFYPIKKKKKTYNIHIIEQKILLNLLIISMALFYDKNLKKIEYNIFTNQIIN